MSTVHNNCAQDRFDIYENGSAAGFLQYELLEGQVRFTHTHFSIRFRERSFPTQVIREVLDEMHRRSLPVLPVCPLVRDFISSHSEYSSLVPSEQRQQFGLAITRTSS